MMHCLPCPHCNANLEVSPAKAGGQIECTQCHGSVAVPKLGELRQLPASVSTLTSKPEATTKASGTSLVFTVVSMLGVGLLFAAGYCGVRYALIDVPIDTETHIAQFKDAYQDVSSAQLIREWESITENGIDLPMPYQYRTMQLTKAGWGRNGLILGIGAAVCLTVAIGLGRSRKTAS